MKSIEEKMDAKAWESEHPVKVFGWAATDSSGVLAPFNFSRRKTGEADVTLKVLFCGICHTDFCLANNEWGISSYPLVPGHEVVGEVIEVGSKVEKFNLGDKVGVGYYVGSCGSCEACETDRENYCTGIITTVGGRYHDGTTSYGGFSNIMVVDQRYVCRIPEGLPLDAAGPLLCAGITVYSPLKRFGLDKPGIKIAVVGLGGVGHLAVRFAKAMGVHVTVISSSVNKKQEAIENLGADAFIVSRDPDEMKSAIRKFDGIIDTVPAAHSLHDLIQLLKATGKLVIVGVPAKPFEVHAGYLVAGGTTVAGSGTGGMKETQEMLEFAVQNGVKPDIEVVPMDYLNTAMERLHNSDVKYRFVIDVGNTLLKTSTL